MKIAIVHNDYGKPSGEEAVVNGLARLLEERGHQIARFSRSSAEIPQKLLGNIQAFLCGTYNPFARRAFARFLDAQLPDVVHIHNLFPFISPSILPECSRRRVPVVMTLHNFRFLCPNALLMRQGKLCRECLGGHEWRCVRHNCERSLAKSLGYAARTAFARRSRLVRNHVAHFICLTAFQRDIYASEGFPLDRLTVIPNPAPSAAPVSGSPLRLWGRGGRGEVADSRAPSTLNTQPSTSDSDTQPSPRRLWGRGARGEVAPPPPFSISNCQNFSLSAAPSPLSPDPCLLSPISCLPTPAPRPYVGYVGRVSPEKDVPTLLAAARLLPEIPFKVAGSYWRMQDLVRQAPPNVQFLGHLEDQQLNEFFAGMALLAFTTRCYENFPTVLLEAMVRRVPIVCTRIGGLPEIVEDDRTGLLYTPQDATDLAAKIRRLWDDHPLARRFAEAGALKARLHYHPDSVCAQHLGVYAAAMERATKSVVPFAAKPSCVS